MKTTNLRRIGLFCLVYGCILAIAFLSEVYFAVWRGEFLPFARVRGFDRADPIAFLLSPISLMQIVSGVAFIAIGYYLLKHSEEKTKSEVRSETFSFLLSGDEKMVFDALKKSGGSMTQKEISQNTGLSSVKTHRVLMRLKSKNAIELHPFGMTNKIVLK